MNKKVLLSTLLASGIVATSLLTGNVKGATNVENYGEKVMTAVQKVEQTETQKSDYIMSVLLESSNPLGEGKNILTRKQVENLLNEKYGKIGEKSILSKVYGKDGSTEIKGEKDPVGTGYTVELATGRKMKVVLYGDINKDGIVDTDDTVEIAKHNVHTVTLDDYQKLAAQLKSKEEEKEESKETIDGINTDDTVRVAYYNVNGLGKGHAGDTIVDMKLYPVDLVEKVNPDDIMKKAVDKTNIADKDKFNITFYPEKNSADFGILGELNEETIANITGTGLMDELVAQLNTYKDNLEKIEVYLVKDEKETGTPAVVKQGMTTEECKNELLKILVNNSESITITKLEDLMNIKLKAKFYIYGTTLFDGEKETTTAYDKGNIIEYSLQFLLDTKKDVENFIKSLPKNDWFTTTIEDHEVKISINEGKEKTKILTDIKGQGQTGIFDALDKFLKSKYITDFGNVTLSVPNNNVQDNKDNGVLNSMTFTFKELKDALKAVKDNSTSITDLKYKEIIKNGILYVNTLLGKSAEYVQNVKAKLDSAESNNNYATALAAELGILNNLELGDLKNKTIELKFDLGENLKNKTNWQDTETYTIKFE